MNTQTNNNEVTNDEIHKTLCKSLDLVSLEGQQRTGSNLLKSFLVYLKGQMKILLWKGVNQVK
jgi:hypothetical protein